MRETTSKPLSIKLVMPRSWSELSGRRLRYVLSLIAKEHTTEEVKTFCLLRWNRIRILGRQGDGRWLLKMGKTYFTTTALSVAEILADLDWMGHLPKSPVRPSRLRGRLALDAELMGVPFSTFIMADNLYQGFLATHDEGLLAEMQALLYPGKYALPAPLPRRRWHGTAVFYWWASLKELYARRWPDFFKSAGPESGGNLLETAAPSPEKSMNAMIRALTKGDVTKERQILEMDTWRALEELNAQARENEEFNRKYGNK